jgi:hypothetical protein
MYTTIYSGGYPSALDFDYRYKLNDALLSDAMLVKVIVFNVTFAI